MSSSDSSMTTTDNSSNPHYPENEPVEPGLPSYYSDSRSCQEIEALQDKVTQKNEALCQKDEVLRKKDEILLQKDEMLMQKDEELMQKDEELQKKDKLIKQKDKTIEEYKDVFNEFPQTTEVSTPHQHHQINEKESTPKGKNKRLSIFLTFILGLTFNVVPPPSQVSLLHHQI